EQSACNCSERFRIHKPIRLIQRRVIESVIKLRSELHIQTFLPEILSQHEIPVLCTWPVERIAGKGAECSSKWDEKGSGIQIDRFVVGILNDGSYRRCDELAVEYVRDVRTVQCGSGIAVLARRA